AVAAGDAVGDRYDGADVASPSDRFEVLDPLLDQVADLGCLDGHVSSSSGEFRSGRQLVRDAIEPGQYRAVDHEIPGAHHGAADELRISLAMQAHGALEL